MHSLEKTVSRVAAVIFVIISGFTLYNVFTFPKINYPLLRSWLIFVQYQSAGTSLYQMDFGVYYIIAGVLMSAVVLICAFAFAVLPKFGKISKKIYMPSAIASLFVFMIELSYNIINLISNITDGNVMSSRAIMGQHAIYLLIDIVAVLLVITCLRNRSFIDFGSETTTENNNR